ncbi:MAG: cob(I)yrinic acid a,c-diamide adenosyltransferase [Candidatus Eremiobacteraeota bacterium]|nr:cob(I)yrinic acid a,c-diamide adenosyltransferase [Candidatus Eremiobacteraeota bacterium]
MRLEKGRVQVYTGDGKGKTTAALGLAIRAAGHGLKIKIIQFMKGRFDYGEIAAMKRFPEISMHQFGRVDLVYKGKEKEIDYQQAQSALKMAMDSLHDPDLDILILDEINVAIHFDLINTESLLDLLNNRPKNMEIIITGRKAPEEIIERADLVTRMESVKHYYDTINLEARKGIEY